MTFWPYYKYVLTSKLSSEQLKQRFDRTPQLQWSDDPAIRTKVIYNMDHTFCFNCDLYRNYLTIVENNDNELGGGRKIKPEAKILFKDLGYETNYAIKIRLNLWVKTFLFLVIVGLCIGISIYLSKEAKEDKFNLSSFMPIVLLIVFYVQLIYSFEKQKTRLKLFIDDFLNSK